LYDQPQRNATLCHFRGEWVNCLNNKNIVLGVKIKFVDFATISPRLFVFFGFGVEYDLVGGPIFVLASVSVSTLPNVAM
jgi:hypothetical protein